MCGEFQKMFGTYCKINLSNFLLCDFLYLFREFYLFIKCQIIIIFNLTYDFCNCCEIVFYAVNLNRLFNHICKTLSMCYDYFFTIIFEIFDTIFEIVYAIVIDICAMKIKILKCLEFEKFFYFFSQF